MNLVQKQGKAIEAIRSISEHYDGDEKEVQDVLDGLAKFIKQEQKEFKAKQAAYVNAQNTPGIDLLTSKDIGQVLKGDKS